MPDVSNNGDTTSTRPAPHPLQEALGQSRRVDAKAVAQRYLDDAAPPSKRGRKVTKPDRETIPTEYERSEEDEIIEQDVKDRGLIPLHNATPPEHRIIQEKPEHRLMVYMSAQGKSAKDICINFGGEFDAKGRYISGSGKYSYAHITQIRRQPWFQHHLVTLLEEEGRDAIGAAIEGQFGPSFETLIQLRDNEDTPANTRASIANSIIDRFLGKPTQHVKTESKMEVHNYEHEAAALDQEEAKLTEELAHLNPALKVVNGNG